MSDYTLRRTGLSDDPHEEDWQAFYKGIPVGRIYRIIGSPARYRWSIYINDTVQPGDDVPLDMSAGALAKAIDVPRTRIERIAAEQVGITTDTAMRLARYFDTSVEFWMNLQLSHDIQVAQKELASEMRRIKPREPANENPEPARYLQRA